MPRSRPAVALLALTASGCAAMSWGFTCPARGGAEWHELTTPHFVVSSDLRIRQARELAGEVERLYGAVSRGLFRSPPEETDRLRVIAFRNRHEFAPFAPAGAAAYYMIADEPVIVLHGQLGSDAARIIAHELTHHVLALAFKRQPLWFAEGMATFMETVSAEGQWSEPTLGGPARRFVPVSPERLERVLTSREHIDHEEYAVAWGLVHFLLNRRAQAFSALQRRFAAGEDPGAAWKEAFPEWDPASKAAMGALDSALRDYLRGGTYTYRRVQLGPRPVAEERALTSSEAHALRLGLPRYRQEGLAHGPREEILRRELRAEVDEALGEDPHNLLALIGRAGFAPDEAPALAKLAVQAHPGDPRAWSFLAAQVPESDPATREAALRRAVQAGPRHYRALAELAALLVATGRTDEALTHSSLADRIAPWNPGVGAVHASALAASGRCAEALVVKRRAVEILGTDAPEEASKLREELARVEEACTPRPVTPPLQGSAPSPP